MHAAQAAFAALNALMIRHQQKRVTPQYGPGKRSCLSRRQQPHGYSGAYLRDMRALKGVGRLPRG